MSTAVLNAAQGSPKQVSVPTRTSMGAIHYLLHLADNAVVLGQRNAEWCGHGPILEEDLALANMSLDLIGQARLLYAQAAERINAAALGAEPPQSGLAPWVSPAALGGNGATEDSLAYLRDAHQFCNFTLLELPHHGPLVGYARSDLDYATTTVRNFLYSAYMVPLWSQLAHAADAALAGIAAKSLKEASYHLRHSRDWLVRLGDGTAESHTRTQAALDHLMPFTQEFWTVSALEQVAADAGIAIDQAQLSADWNALVDDALAEATLQRPTTGGYVTQGKLGHHSEHLGYLLAEMQSLHRAHPGAPW